MTASGEEGRGEVEGILYSSLLLEIIYHFYYFMHFKWQSLGWEDPLEEEAVTQLQYSCLGNPMESGAW